MKFEPLDARSSDRLVNHFRERYGVPGPVFENLAWLSNKHFGWLLHKQALTDLSQPWNLQSAGLLVFVDLSAFKPTTLGLRFFAPHIARNRIELEPRLVSAFLHGSRLDLSADQFKAIDSTGYVAVFCNGDCLGSAYADLSRKTLHPNLSKTKETDFIEAQGFANQAGGQGRPKGRGQNKPVRARKKFRRTASPHPRR